MLNESKTLVMLVRYRTVELQQGTKYHATQRLGRGQGRGPTIESLFADGAMQCGEMTGRHAESRAGITCLPS